MTTRQLQIARMVADGQKHEAIAAAMGIKNATVAWHLRKIYERTGAWGHALLVRWLIRNGLIEP